MYPINPKPKNHPGKDKNPPEPKGIKYTCGKCNAKFTNHLDAKLHMVNDCE